MQDYIIEIATTDYTTTRSAVLGGADRIELCTALSEGGLTPSYGVVQQCCQDFDVPIFPILRPRAGDFLYTETEFEIIRKDALRYKLLGCDGVVVGFLNSDGTVNKDRTAEIAELVYPLEVTFHRAFDRCMDPFEAMEMLIKCGCQRILTSGQKPTAPEGQELIRQLIDAAKGRIVIMPGSGVRAENILDLAATGAMEFHSSLKGKAESRMQFRHPAFAASAESYSHAAIEPDAVQELKKALMKE